MGLCSVRTKVIYSSPFKLSVSNINGRNYSNDKNPVQDQQKQSETQVPNEEVQESNEEPKETPKESSPEDEIYRDQVELGMAHDAQIEILKKQINDVKYNWRLTLADLDNLTKKAHKDTALAREAGAEKIIRKLFPLMDNIDYCLKMKPDFSSPELVDNLEARGAFDGLESAKKQFCNALVSYEVHEIFPMLGDVFDPLVHEAIFQIEQPVDENIKPGQIGEILKAGWIKKGILLRPASVGVVKIPEIPIPFNFKREEGDESVMVEDDSDDGSGEIELDEKKEKCNNNNNTKE